MEQLKKHLKNKGARKKSSIHTSRHALAEEMAEYFNELKDYRKYLGVCFQYPEEKLRGLFAEVRQECQRNYKLSPVKIFFWKLKQLEKTHVPKGKNLSKGRKGASGKSKRGDA